MSENPSCNAPPGHRWGLGAESVLRYLLGDLALKPAPLPTYLPRPSNG